MGPSGLLPILVPFILLESVQKPGLVEGFMIRICPRNKVKCEFEERDQCRKSLPCPRKMKCCKFNCGKKCLDLNEDICSLPQVAGHCMASISRWWYNKTTQMCSRFIYGGCQGNNNNFQSESICKTICSKNFFREEVTGSPSDAKRGV